MIIIVIVIIIMIIIIMIIIIIILLLLLLLLSLCLLPELRDQGQLVVRRLLAQQGVLQHLSGRLLNLAVAPDPSIPANGDFIRVRPIHLTSTHMRHIIEFSDNLVDGLAVLRLDEALDLGRAIYTPPPPPRGGRV